MAKLLSPENLAKFLQYCRMYGLKSATRMALRRLRRPKGAFPQHPTLLVRSLDLQPGIAPLDKRISVIIPTRNAGGDLGRLLRKLRAQEGVRQCEIIIVDSGSTDETVATAATHSAKVISIASTEFTHANARNKGAEAASGEYLLFMVQDALPSSNSWVWELAAALESRDLAAVSCAEYPRSDADLFYQFLIYTQYGASGQNQDRILQWDDSCASYLGLRSNAQLCNIAALVRRPVFEQYRFRTAYAEDLDLGIRLIRDGYKLGFLYSTRVLHSHNRAPFYFLKRGYVDARFLTSVFPNFVYPEIDAKEQLYWEIIGLHERFASASRLLSTQSYPLPLTTLIDFYRRHTFGNNLDLNESADPEIRSLMYFLCKEVKRESRTSPGDCRMLWPHVSKHIEGFLDWLSSIYTEADQILAADIANAMHKILALHSGTHLAYLFMTLGVRKRVDDGLQQLDSMLMAGV